ncbi:MFS general substrate transporter [Wolfiporia cocos MD-104 SS10]|uniref:MFS general substrate transporter n=1 Tax=Wolfiporia cocos (strain MD-104) TaxID=742152 RepID=A0A2H3JGK9_WOLCO|nr:MFS general substrate transporter [Wolfiporia cocos MD-104 SS10]
MAIGGSALDARNTLPAMPTGSPKRGRLEWRAWSTVVGAWLMQFCVVGIVSSYGVMQTFYAQEYLNNVSDSAISWIGTVQLFFMLALSPIGGLLLDRGYLRQTLVSGSLFFVVCQFLLSLAHAHQYYQVFLSQGLGMGIGVGLIYMPTFGIVSQHFKQRRALAIGIVASGSSLGTVVFSIALNYLLNGSLGFGWSIRVTSFMSVGLLALGNILIVKPVPALPIPPNSASAPDVTTLNAELSTTKGEDDAADKQLPIAVTSSPLLDKDFVLLLAMGFLFGLGQWFPSYYIQIYAEQHGVNSRLSFYSLAIMNISAMFGRVVPNGLADRWGNVEVYVPCTLCAGAIGFAMLGCGTTYGLVLFTIFYGFFFGAGVSLYLPVVHSLCAGKADMGKRMGIALFPVGVASLIGNPINGAILGSSLTWWKGVTFASTTMLAGAACMSAVLYSRVRNA